MGFCVYFAFVMNPAPITSKVYNDSNEITNSPEKNKEISKNESVSPLSSEDFIINDTSNYIELGSKYVDLITNEKVIKTVPANEKHIYDIYEFENFKIIIQPDGGDGNTIISIDLITSFIQTSRGISVGDKISEVVEKYGIPYDSSEADLIAPGQYNYQFNGKFITFFVNEYGEVVLIRFEIT